MNNINIVLVDDDKHYIDLISQYLEKISIELQASIHIWSSTSYEPLSVHEADIYILDIIMPVTGFDIAAYSLGRSSGQIVFVSSQEDLVFQSFAFQPYAFIRKSNLFEDIRSLMSRYVSDRLYVISITKGKSTYQINSKMVYLLSVFRNNMSLYWEDKSITVKTSMKQFLTSYPIFSASPFIQINQSEIININFVSSVKKQTCILLNGRKMYISRKYYSRFREKYYTTAY